MNLTRLARSFSLTFGILLLAGCNSGTNLNTSDAYGEGDITTPTTQTEETNNQETMPEATAQAVIKTNFGEMTFDLYGDQAPETVKNFTTLAEEGKYNDVPFHRVIKDFMIQTGDFTNKNGTGGHSYKGPGTSIPDEFDPALTHTYGALSMANRGPNTGGSQFFIVQAKEGTPWLNGAHAIFGQLTDGEDVLEKIAALETDASDKPLEEAMIESIEIK